MDIFSSSGASLLVLLVQGLLAWALWSLRRVFVRQEDYALHVRRDARRDTATERRLNALEERLRQAPDGAALDGLRDALAALRGQMLALDARMLGLERLLVRLEHGLERQEDRLDLLPAVTPGAHLGEGPAGGGN